MIGKFFAAPLAQLLAGICAALLAFAVVQTVRIEGFWFIDGYKASLAASERARKAHFDAHVQTIRNYRNAQKQAQIAEKARLARVKGEQERISDNVSQDYARDLAALRARYDRLRRQARAADGKAGGVAVSGIPDAAFGTDAAPGGDGFLAILRAADENTLKLMRLQEWITDQLGVVINESPGP